jgi:hypothetical protein
MQGDTRKVQSLRERHPRIWNDLTPEQKRVALANALSLDNKVLDRAIRLAKKYDLEQEAQEQVAPRID